MLLEELQKKYERRRGAKRTPHGFRRCALCFEADQDWIKACRLTSLYTSVSIGRATILEKKGKSSFIVILAISTVEQHTTPRDVYRRILTGGAD